MHSLVRCGSWILIACVIAACQDSPYPTMPTVVQESHGTTPSHFSAGLAIGLDLIADGFVSPLALRESPDGTGRLFVVDQTGAIRIIDPDGSLQADPFLDVSDRMVTLMPAFDERGLLGLAFHPDYADNGRFFVYYSAPLRPCGPDGWNHTSHISEFRVSADPDLADAGSEQVLLQVDQPQFNHNAGGLAFGPDGFLYISLGDGGGANDVGLGHTPDLGNGQDITNLLGAILRIDVDGGSPYAIPSDNPFVGEEGRDEIYAFGLRNPYRFSFDMGGGQDLLAADVGQNLWEEVNLIERGGNYGWNIKEGTHCFDPDNPNESPPDCPDVGPFGHPLLDPVIEYGNIRVRPDGLGIAVIGGYVYRGSDVLQLGGRYVFGDWSTAFGAPDGRLFTSRPSPHGLWPIQELRVQGNPGGRLGHYLVAFGQDAAGEVYVLTTDNAGPTGETGRVYRVTRPGAGQGTPGPVAGPERELYRAKVEPEGGSRVRGTARFEIAHGLFSVSVRVNGLAANERIPQHIHVNPTCAPAGGILINLDEGLTVAGEGPPAGDAYPRANPGGVVVYDAQRPLDDLAAALDTHLGMTLDELDFGERNVNFHEPLPEPIPSQGCGEIERIN
jgi:glucose/arabinose dehydrogenase